MALELYVNDREGHKWICDDMRAQIEIIVSWLWLATVVVW